MAFGKTSNPRLREEEGVKAKMIMMMMMKTLNSGIVPSIVNERTVTLL